MKTIRFGIIGCGMMGREFASAAARWFHLPGMNVRPEIVAVCNRTLSSEKMDFFTRHVPSLRLVTSDYRELLAHPEVEAVYVAVPHNAHKEIYSAALQAGKHLLGEKPFGIDKPANQAILKSIAEHPDVLVRCVSQFLFFPAVQRICSLIESRSLGRIIECNCGFLHSSDLDPQKPLNWKRTIRYNGEYGCMGDLGPHVCYIPFRAGWIPQNVRALLSNIIPERPDGQGQMIPCETWDNATLLCQTRDQHSGDTIPLTIRTQRISPGQKNNWYLEILGTKASAKFSTKEANTLYLLEYTGPEQAWRTIDMGQETPFESISHGIFQFGVSDALLQMWAAFLYELDTGRPSTLFAGCITPEETALWHNLFTAALQSHQTHAVVPLE